jgi:GntR family transcriptional regulator
MSTHRRSPTGQGPPASGSPPISRRVRPLLADVIRTKLREAIVSGEFPLGTKLPNEEQLCDRFSVSRVTIREAVRGLIEDGYVVRRQGSGTYVRRRPSLRNSLDTNFSYSEYLAGAGVRTDRQVLDAQMVPADAETAQALAIAVGTEVAELRRLRTADRRPAIYSIDVLPGDLVDSVDDRDRFRGSVHRLLSGLGHPVEHGEAVVAPALADSDTAGPLEVAPGTPLQHLRQVDFDAAGRPVMLSLEWHVPAIIELRVCRRGPGPLGGAGPTG